ncbi:winged helix-turn-helix transcriptional regulator [Pseudoroseicyclus sp. H15]
MNMPTGFTAEPECARLIRVLGLLGDKWSVLIIMVLREEPHRFNALNRAVHGISRQMLTRTLKGLQAYGLVSRTVTPLTPPEVTYALTDLGRSLASPLEELGLWVDGHIDEIEANERKYLAGRT